MNYTPADLLPHAAPMILLDEILACDGDQLSARAVVPHDGLFNAADDAHTVPAYLVLEYMAQAVAALEGWRARARGQSPQIGFLLGCRKLDCPQAVLLPGSQLDISVHEVLLDDDGMGVFDADLVCQPGDIHFHARLTAYQPPNAAALHTALGRAPATD